MSEKLCLQWNEYQNIFITAFGDLRNHEALTDVTLVCEDGKQIKAHKVVLASTSPFFLDLLKRNKHPHPLVYMKGIKSDNVKRGNGRIGEETTKVCKVCGKEGLATNVKQHIEAKHISGIMQTCDFCEKKVQDKRVPKIP